MNIQEFETLLGRQVSLDFFKYANGVYMETDLDKGMFVEEWKNVFDSDIIKQLMERLTRYKKHSIDGREIGKLLVKKADEYDDKEIYDAAKRMLGQTDCICEKLDAGLELTKEDIMFIKNKLGR